MRKTAIMRAETSEKSAAEIAGNSRALLTKPLHRMESRAVGGGARILSLYLLTLRGSLYWMLCIRRCIDTISYLVRRLLA